MKFLHIRVFVVALLLLQVAALPQIKDHLDPGLTMVRIPFDKSQSATSQGPGGDTSFFPSDPRNIWMYWYDREGGDPNPFVRHIHVLDDSVVAGKIYYKYKISGLLRYDRPLGKLFALVGTTEKLVADFNIAKPGSRLQTGYDILGFAYDWNYTVSLDTITVFGKPYTTQIYDLDTFVGSWVSRYFEFVKGLGPVYLYESVCCHGGSSYTRHSIRQAKIYDETGVSLYFNPSDKPVISFIPPPAIIDTNILRKAIKTGHPFNKWHGSPSWPGFFNFIDSAIIQGYYSKRTDSIPAPNKRLVYNDYSDTSMIDYRLNDSLMLLGYQFNYRFIAIDKGIIPQSDTLPKNGYFSVKYPPAGIDELPPIELGYDLAQNYPNPFTGSEGSTEIRYTLRHAGHVKGVVYDLLGSEVAVLLDGEMPKGEHTVKFDGKGLSPGVYFFRLTCGGNSKAIKMVVN